MSHKTRSFDLGKPEAARFWGRVQRGAGDACWLWTGSRMTRGYGQVYWGNGPKGAHRVAWELSHGPIPEGQHILHRCDVPACVNPDHLFIGTHTENMKDAATKGRLHAPRPGRQKLTDAQIDDIAALVQSGMKRYLVAARYGVSKGFVSGVMNGTRRQWRQAPAQRRIA
jgi:hypothetical protein